MTMGRLEHLNVTVADPKATARMLAELLGWRVRWEGAALGKGYTVHVGTDDAYIALYTGPEGTPLEGAHNSYSRKGGLNHLGVTVDDLDAAEAKVRALGYEPYSHADYEPGRRFYFREENGVEIEVVSYG
jgi:catechol 2,3-dioxygenase-like lactoylglutathione lyase family enzyme